MWVIWGVLSALLLGVYEVVKKVGVDHNAVIPVLFFSTVASSLVFLPLVFLSVFYPAFLQGTLFYVPTVSFHSHLLILLKSVIVVSSWLFGFFAVKNLPLTIVTPVRSTGPVWTLIGAIFLFGEHLSPGQWVGTIVTLFFFYLFSTAGKLEGINFFRNKWIWYIIICTLIGAVSGLYDKYIIHQVDRMAVQAYFCFYQVLILIPVVLFAWYPSRKKSTKFHWRWSIPAIGVLLVIADFLYFYSLSYSNSLISILSAVRRGGIVVTFVLGAFLFKERNIGLKSLYLLGIMVGIFILMMTSK